MQCWKILHKTRKSDKQIKNLGHMHSAKQEGIICLFYTNPNGFGPNTCEKIQTVLKNQKRVWVNEMVLSSPDWLWNSRRVDNLRMKLLRIGKNVKINASNTSKITTSAHRHLPGGAVSLTWDQLSNLVQRQESNNKLDCWSSIIIRREWKTTEIITFAE